MTNIIATIAPTTSFWDCGEFIAGSYTVGVPHPPGAPLYLLIGRLFAMLPLGENIGFRVNLVSGFLSALTILLLYLCIVRILRAWRGAEKSASDKIAVYGSAAVGALAFAFSHSFWFNAVEAEVYSVSLFFTAIVFYFALLWMDYADVPKGNRILLFIFYLIGLSSGIHLLNILALISVTYIVAFKKKEANLKNFIITGVIGSTIIIAIYPGLIQGVPLLIVKFSIWSILVIFAVLVFLAIHLIKTDRRLPAFFVLSSILVIVGYSTFLLIKIRSGLDPFLDENDPETWSRLLAYLNREQYGTESLFLTMFQRKAPFWEYQIKHMYLRYLGWQYIEFSRLWALPFLLGVWGAVHHFHKDSKGAFTVLALFIMTGFAVLVYLNQEDPQPRERDYAYVGSFFAFAIWIGIGVVALIDTIQTYLKKVNMKLATSAVTFACLALVPFNMWIKNYDMHDRSGNYVAWDYSYNLLQTCEQDAILYTNGDNDTFPLWYLQVVEEVRTDVRVVNLSLLNTGWFIKQLRDKEPVMPMPRSKFTDDYIDNRLEARDISGLRDRYWSEKKKVSINGPTPSSPKLIWDVPATMSIPVGTSGKYEHFLRVQDLMILNTIAANQWQRPICFAVTVSDNNLLGLRDIRNQSNNYLSMEGLAFKLHPEPVPLIDIDLIAHNLFNVYKYRGINDPDVYFNDNIIKLLGNYRQGLIQLAYNYLAIAQETGDTISTKGDLSLEERIKAYKSLPAADKALTALDFMEYQIPEALIPIKFEAITIQIGRIYSRLGRPDEMQKRLKMLSQTEVMDAQKSFEYGLYFLSEGMSPADAREMFDLSLKQNTTIDNYQRIAYSWLQLSLDPNYPQEILQRYIESNNDRQTKLRIAAQAMMFGLDDFALSVYEPLWNSNPGDNAALNGLIEYHQRKGEFRKAVAYASDWLGANPGDSSMARLRSELQEMADNANR